MRPVHCFVLAVTAVAALLIVSCRDDDDPAMASPTATASATEVSMERTPVVPPATAWPKDKRTGHADVDALLDAVYSGEAARVESLFELVAVPCATETRYSDPVILPPCGDEPVGTPIDAFPTDGCSAGWSPGVYPIVDSLLIRSPRLYAVYRQPTRAADPPDRLPAGGVVVLLTNTLGGQPDSHSGVIALELEDGKVVLETGPCEPLARFMAQIPDASFILKPPGGVPAAVPTSAPRLTGDATTDRIIRALVDGDWQTLVDNFVLYPEPCAANPEGVGSPAPCPSGVAAGSTIQGARLMACERAYITDPARDFPPLFRPMFAFPHELYAAYNTSGGLSYDWVPQGSTALVIGEREGDRLVNGQTWFIKDGKIVGALLGCGQAAEALVQGLDPSDFILPPP